mmetsp:Transcript_30418/g.98051  ORF Transcript_30418/g.98051 Transcript_30418/m.98051 type:complete len:217 (+) Transcript_30418:3-653(+)
MNEEAALLPQKKQAMFDHPSPMPWQVEFAILSAMFFLVMWFTLSLVPLVTWTVCCGLVGLCGGVRGAESLAAAERFATRQLAQLAVAVAAACCVTLYAVGWFLLMVDENAFENAMIGSSRPLWKLARGPLVAISAAAIAVGIAARKTVIAWRAADQRRRHDETYGSTASLEHVSIIHVEEDSTKEEDSTEEPEKKHCPTEEHSTEESEKKHCPTLT